MGVDHPGLGPSISQLVRIVKQQVFATIQRAGIGSNGLRVHSGGWIRIENGGLSITGDGEVSGTFTVTGELGGSGTLDWSGPVYLRGTTQIYGGLIVSGAATLDNVLNVRSGRIVAGPVIIDRNGSYGGRIASTGTLLLDASSAVVLGAPATVQGAVTAIGLLSGTSIQSLSNITALGNITAIGDIGGGSKSFWIDHPTEPGKQLRHGSLEGPEHGVFYRGTVEFDGDGEAVFELPGYFTALVLGDDVPTVQVTPIGRPFLTGAEHVEDGLVTVYGDPGREAHVTVLAARERFDVEPVKEPLEPIASEWAPPSSESEGE